MFLSVIQSQENQRKGGNHSTGKSIIGKKAKKEAIAKNLNLHEFDLDRNEEGSEVLHTEEKLLPKTQTTKEPVRRSSTKNKIDMMGKLNSYIFKEKVKRSQNTNYSKTKHFEFLYFQYMANSMAQCVFALASIFSCILLYEFEFTEWIDEFDGMAEWWCLITSVLLWITIVYEHYINSKIFSLNKSLPESVARKETDNLMNLFFTLIIFFLHPNPVFHNVYVTIKNEKYNKDCIHSVNSIMTCFCLLRMWYFVKFYLIYSDYYSPRSQRVCMMNGFDTNLTFSMKANMSKTPYFAYVLLFMVVLMYCSFCLRIFERVLDDVSGKNFASYWNSVWCLIITMTTVGYGDFFPSSTLGRTIGIIACICGVFLISMLIVTITNILHFEGTEENVFLILQRLKLTKDKDQLAAQLISKYMKLMKHLKESKDNPQEALKSKKAMRDDILLGLYYLKEKNKEIDATFPAYSNFDIVIDNLEMLDFSMNTIKNKYEKLEKNLAQLIQKIE